MVVLARLLLYITLIAFCFGAVPAPAVAQQPAAVRFENVIVGYDGVVRRNHWFPITVTVSNDGPDVIGELVWQGSGATYRRAVDLPQGAKKRLTLLAIEDRNLRNSGTLSLQVAGQRLLEEPYRLTVADDDDTYLVGVIGDDPGLLNSLSSMTFPTWRRVQLVRLSADQLPEEWPALTMLNALFLGGSSEGWSEAQRNALATWVELGGQLVVGGGINSDRVAAGLLPLLPVELGAGLVELPLQPLVAAGGRAVEPAQTAARVVTPRPGAQTLAQGPLLVAQPRGAGQVVFATFDLATLRGWTGEPRLWETTLQPQQLRVLGAAYRRDNDNLLQNALQLPGLGLPSIWSLLLYLLLYVLLIGPANYLVLRRLDKREWAWLTVPLTVGLFALGTYALGFGARGGNVLLNQVAVVQAREGGERAAVTAFLGMFSPRRSAYTVNVAGNTLVSEVTSFDGTPGGPVAPLLTAEGVTLQNLLLDVGSLRTVVAESATALPFSVQSSLRSDGATLEGELLLTGLALQEAVLVSGDHALPLGELRSGAALPVRLQLSSNNFPWGSGATTEGTFNRQRIIESIFSNSRLVPFNATGAPLLHDNNTYLLGWVEQPQVDATINGTSASNDLTLYIVQLNQPSAS